MGTQTLARGSTLRTMPLPDPDCEFCEIIAREEDAREVLRTPLAIAFFPTEPATLGHTLLIPRDHISTVWDLDPELAAELGRRTVELAVAIREATQPEGLNVIQSNGTVATQTVPHLHVHIVPRWEDDGVGRIWPPETSYSESDKDETWESIRQAVRRLGSS
jgi:histidine triad (HIT) family protein